ncbi:MAG: hypothetical protein JEZ07_01365 [Phycisphaerae bacterium]|nr:hypothetical protein [Phycisphaerae bacterium]
MFERRLKILIVIFLLAIAGLVTRLYRLGVLGQEYYQNLIQESLETQGKWLDTVRGTIYDRNGRVLAEDIPVFNVCIHYKLALLYDPRFRRLVDLQFLTENPGQEHSLEDNWQNLYGKGLARAQNCLVAIAEKCGIDKTEIDNNKIPRINASIYKIRLDQARRSWFRERELSYVPVSDKDYDPDVNYVALLEADFQLKYPDELKRLEKIYATDIYEMYQPYSICEVGVDVATEIDDMFSGMVVDLEEKDVWPFGKDSQFPIEVTYDKTRVYPYRDAACHLIGQVGRYNEFSCLLVGHNEVNVDYSRYAQPDQDQLGDYHLNDRMGFWGFELACDKRLRGWRGWIKRDIEGKVVTDVPIRPGDDVQVTIDIDLQKRIARVFNGANPLGKVYKGAAVLIDVNTGQVLAAVSVPTFDLQNYFKDYDQQEINANADKKYYNRAFSYQADFYQPGSTAKVTHLLGALENGYISPGQTYDCYRDNIDWLADGSVLTGVARQVHNHGYVGPEDAIRVSCNFYFAKVANKVGYDKMISWLDKAGFGREILSWPDYTDADCVQKAFKEFKGYLRSLNSRRGVTDEEIRAMGIGLNPFAASILQVANSMATVGRDGVYLEPTLIIDKDQVKQKARRIASVANTRIVQNGMAGVIYEGGTGKNLRNLVNWDPDVLKIYAKTGSTDFSVFSSYAKAVDGRCLALAIVVESSVDGAVAAGPLSIAIYKQVAESEFNYLPKPQE